MNLRETGRLLALGCVVALVGIVLILLFGFFKRPAPLAPQAVITTPVGPPSEEVAQYLELNRHFDALVSYTSGRFEPDEIDIPEGGVVRFTNNTRADIWIQEVSDDNAPESPNTNDCRKEIFATCHPLKPGEFWESTFYATGTMQYINTMNAERRAVRINIR
ncbi:hypothetical protein A2765_02405 [Candidatus Kaiserbacteria bacterium RIFCSPHIGHO2_01_FULL_56_24]|uniref:Uncharacterized protein n=1 Tax=Candidatus Kaiserbacteria bacterium RIFCSPHIGHO2_01_FULL_56_24 TaxID=1798487 RepID=A0A1F6DAZ2_9BACT|nr:MAG: hypothetical protein A2765_02405 [Candidatus Kaiserbacteria bacterium RIFCSPHIGHO2_01_FULL_56_24]